MRDDIVTVRLWDTPIGYLGYGGNQNEFAIFEYDKNFLKYGVSPSPLKVPLSESPYLFDTISKRTFHGLPGFIADALPDKFGNQLIDQYFAREGILSSSITALDRLLYIGDRSMGALSFEPSRQFERNDSMVLDINRLHDLSEMVLNKKEQFRRELAGADHDQALQLLKVGSSAGGARSKALVAVNNEKEEEKLYDGTVIHSFDASYYLLKFDSNVNSDRDGKDPKGITKVEYIYSKIARQCEIDIPDTRFINDGDNFHYMIERFDRLPLEGGGAAKIHYVSWCGMAHADRDTTGAYSYEQLVLAIRELGLGQDAVLEIFKRAIFNIVGRNQDDHTKNFGFLMLPDGEWVLSPAFDMVYSYDPTGKWTKVHQITLNGKQDGFTREDIVKFGEFCNLSKKESIEILDRTIDMFSLFGALASELDTPERLTSTIMRNLRLHL